MPFRWLFLLFGAFIVACGFSHFLDALTTHVPVYRLAGLLKVVTAVLSWATVLALVPVVHQLLALRSPDELRQEVAARIEAEGALHRANAELDLRVLSRTEELEQTVASLCQEVEQRKQVERALLSSQEQLRLVTDNAPVLLVHCDAERRYKFVNRAYAECFGLTPKDMVGRLIPEVIGEQAYERIRTNLDAALAGERVDREVEGPYEGTERRWLHFTCLPQYSASGEVTGALAVIIDVTERRKAEELVHAITDTVPALISYVDAGGLYRLNNRAYQKWFGCSRSDMVGRHMRDVLGDAAWAVVGPRVGEALAGQAVRFEDEVSYKDGGTRWIDATYTPHRDAHGAVARAVVMVTDITDRKAAERAVRASEARFRHLADTLPQIVWSARPDGYIEWYNRRWYDYTGSTPEQTEGWGWQSVHDPDELPSVLARWTGCITSGDPFEMVFPLRAADGRFRSFLSRCVPVRDADGRIVQWFGTNTDITERIVAETALRASEVRSRGSEARFRHLADTLPQIVWSARPDGVLDYYNRRWYELTGSHEGAEGDESWLPVLHPDDRQPCIDVWYEAVRTGRPYQIEYRFKFPGMDVHRWYLGRALPVQGEAGDIVRWYGTCTDIDDQKQAEQQLLELNATLEQRVADRTAAAETERRLLDAVLDAMPVAVIISEADGRLVRLNRACEQVWGFAPRMSTRIDEYGEWVGYWPATGKRVEPHEWALSRALLNAEVCPGELMEIERFGHRDRRFIINSAAPVWGPDGAIMAGVVASMDVTDRVVAEGALREGEERFRSAFDDAPGGMYLKALDGRWLKVNRAMCAMVGRTEADMLATSAQAITHPGDVDAHNRHLESLLAGHAPYFQLEMRYVHRGGQEVWVLVSASLVRNSSGVPLYFVGHAQDITVRQVADAQVKASLHEKSVLLKEIHHRVKNNLQVICSLLDLQSQYTDDDKAVGMFKESRNRVRSMALVHERLYRSADLARVDFADYIESLATHLFATYRTDTDRIGLDVDVRDVRPPIDTAVPCGLLVNELVSNCLKHAFRGRDRGRITIELLPLAGGEAMLRVGDDGVGMPAGWELETAESFGLHLVLALVDQLHGTVRVERDGGTAFRIIFPLG